MNPQKKRLDSWEDIGIDEYKFQPNRRNIRVSCPSCERRTKLRNQNFWVYGDAHTFGECKSSSCEYSCGFYVYSGSFSYPEPHQYAPIRDEDKQWEDIRWAKRLGLAQRGLTRADLNAAGVFPTPYNWQEKEGEGIDFAIAYPLFDEMGKCVNVAYRPPQDRKHLRMRFHKGGELIFYNLNCLKDFVGNDKEIPYICITEGYEDCLSCVKAGLKYSLSVPNGVTYNKDNPTPPTMKYLVRNLDLIKRAKVIYIFTDNDGAGEFLAGELARRIGIAKCRRVKTPYLELRGKKVKDANDILQWSVLQRTERADWQMLGLSIIGNILTGNREEGKCYTENFPLQGIADAQTDNDRVLAMLEEEEDRGLRISIGNEKYPTDDILRFNTSRMGAIYGRPNTAKTDIWINFAVRLAYLHGWKFAIYCPETGKSAKLKAHICEVMLGKKISKNPFLGDKATPLEVNMALAFFDEHFLIIDEKKVEGESITLNKFMELGKEYVELHGVNCLVCDPFNAVEGAYGSESGMASNVVLQRDLKRVQDFKREYNCSVWFVIHPSKAGLQNAKGSLTSFDSAYFSSVWEAKLDWILVVNRLVDSGVGRPGIYGDDIQLIVAKNKEPLEGKALAQTTISYSHVTGQTGIEYDYTMGAGGINYRAGSFKRVISIEQVEAYNAPDIYEHFKDRENTFPQIDDDCPF